MRSGRAGARARIWRSNAIMLMAVFALTLSGVAWAQTAPPRPGGFWKEKAKGEVKAEFNGEDPIGLAAGKHIPTNCAINRPRDGGKIYCYSSLPSLEFLDSTPELLAKAQAFWDREHAHTSSQ